MKANSKIGETTISLEEATQRTDLWRQKFMETFTGSGQEDVFRGFLIPIQSILDIAAKFPDKGVDHVRAYLTAQPESPGDPNFKLSICLVPAIMGDGDVAIDLFRYVEHGVITSAIYDFTQPCPPCCDVTSPLHGPSAKK